MKKYLILALACILTACSEPKEILLTKSDDIEKNAEQIKKLSDEDKKLLMGYIARVEGGKLFGGNDDATYGITVGQAIEKQKEFVKIQKEKEEAKAAAEAQARAEAEAKRQQLNAAVDVIYAGHKFIEGEYSFENEMVIDIKFINKSQKTITGTKGIAIFYDNFGDVLRRIGIKQDFDQIDGKLEPGQDYIFYGSVKVYTDEEIKLAKSSPDKIKFVYEPEVVLFEDGSELKM